MSKNKTYEFQVKLKVQADSLDKAIERINLKLIDKTDNLVVVKIFDDEFGNDFFVFRVNDKDRLEAELKQLSTEEDREGFPASILSNVDYDTIIFSYDERSEQWLLGWSGI